MDTTLADSSDHDVILGISDGISFVGFIAFDNHHVRSPCFKFEGMVVENTIQKEREGSGPVLAYNYSSEIKVRIKPNEKWGSCHTEHNGGYVNSQSYHYSLDLAKGLQFDLP